MIRFTVPGIPAGKGRPRISTRGGFARAFTPAKTVAYEGLIALAASDAMAGREPIAGPVMVVARAVFPIPASWSKRRKAEARWHVGKPDGDNVLKALGDGLNGIAWKDDSQVASMRLEKVYGNVPGLHVEIEVLA